MQISHKSAEHLFLPARSCRVARNERFFIRCITIAAQALLLGAWVLFAGNAQAVTMNDVSAGELLFATDANGHWNPAAQLDTKVDMRISGPVAEVTVEQHFKNASSDWVEGKYVFPLPETAVVNAMNIRVGEQIIVGEIHEKHAAKHFYEAAKENGQRTALVEQQKPNMFSSKVANIGPGEEISVTITYLEKVAFEHGRFKLRFPMTITPQYIPGKDLPGMPDSVFSAGVAQSEIGLGNPLSGWAHPPGRSSITVDISPGMQLADVSSSYHAIHLRQNDGNYRVEFANGSVPMDRDFELTWQPVASAVPRAAVFTEEIDGESYALAMVIPPDQASNVNQLQRETIFVVDTSGSMGGASIQQAREALKIGLRTLNNGDTFNVIEFNSDTRMLFSNAMLASGAYMQDALEFVANLKVDGGTDIGPAIDVALGNQTELPANALRQVIFITDAGVINEDELFRQIKSQLGESRLFTVGIGSAPNNYFMRKAAQFGRGTFTYIGKIDEVGEKMAELFSQLAAPQLRDIELTWPAAKEVFPVLIPDLYAGQPLTITAKLNSRTAYLDSSVQITGTTPYGEWKRQFKSDRGKAHAGIGTLWARDKIAALNDRIIAEGESDLLRDAIIDVALLHKIMSRYTSFVAVDRTPVRPLDALLKGKRVPNARPAGHIYAYPATATPAIEKLWFALLCFAVAAQLWWLQRRGLAGKRKWAAPEPRPELKQRIKA